ncbi:unnamed protein product [Paramecium pentaurelia]|uniref:Uncharacterized protein n=1 Tax=Paramecium pentaurelia TaxID=43138 RepID=A0A8S1Y7X9_9CILI|nr:unnamed protein product [Paramecium pentaurelia]
MISFTFYNPNLLVKDFILQFSKNLITYNSQLFSQYQNQININTQIQIYLIKEESSKSIQIIYNLSFQRIQNLKKKNSKGPFQYYIHLLLLISPKRICNSNLSNTISKEFKIIRILQNIIFGINSQILNRVYFIQRNNDRRIEFQNQSLRYGNHFIKFNRIYCNSQFLKIN